MPHLPVLSRLSATSYLALLLSITLILLESLISLITLLLPRPIITLCYTLTKRAFNTLSSPQGRQSRSKKRAVVNAVAQAADFVELCELWGYSAEEHIVQTGDGYLLGLHRVRREGSGGDEDGKKPVVYLHHGLMMNSEVWVCMTEQERCLPFVLVERGYDVWLGNNRGNKYSKKCLHRSPRSPEFWDFSIDQFAFHDIPDSISYILSTTSAPSLSYIGFSQGTAQAFATLSIHPQLNEKVNLFIALAPAMAPGGLTSGIVDSFVKASPEVLFLAFGRKALLSSTSMWEAILYPPIFVRMIDYSLRFLFSWRAANISPHQKLAAYPHLFSYTSVKSVVHWFQIIRNGTFQMFDDEVQGPWSISRSKYYKVAKYPTRNIRTPIVLVYGGSDSLVDINVMLKELPRGVVAKEIPHYEHLDFLWASDTDKLVFPHVFDALEKHRYRDHALTAAPRLVPERQIKRLLNAPVFSEDDGETPLGPSPRKISETTAGFRGLSEGPESSTQVFESATGSPDTSALQSSTRTPTVERFSLPLSKVSNSVPTIARKGSVPNPRKSNIAAGLVDGEASMASWSGSESGGSAAL